MADPASIQLLSPGQLVNVVMTTGDGFDQPAASRLLAAAVPVLWTSGNGGDAGQWLASGEAEGLMVVAADADQTRRLAGASTQGSCSSSWCGLAPGSWLRRVTGPAGATGRPVRRKPGPPQRGAR
ncbi:hypothetical protein PJ267_20060 [Arthrobacter sp. OVS8]|nr:hypothetical protein PJ267_20060 [Arthrobacter sp. OVS8]